MIRVFYDSDCPICQSEIEHLAAKNSDKILGIPIKYALDGLKAVGINEIESLTYLCLKDESGTIYKEMSAVRLLHKTAGTKTSVLFELPIIKPMSEIIYPIFARHGYKIPKWIAHLLFVKPKAECEDGICQIAPKDRIKQ